MGLAGGMQINQFLICPSGSYGVVKHIYYFPNSSLLNASRGKKTSWAWSSIIQGREISEAGLKMAGV